MVTVKQKFTYLPDGTIDISAWLQKITHQHQQLKNLDVITKACLFTQKACKGLTTFYGQPCIEQSLEMAEIILDLNLDHEAVAAAIIANTNRPPELMATEFSSNIVKLVMGIGQMNVINMLANSQTRNQNQIDRIRKTLLAMVSDIRVVVIKLAERTSLMRGIKHISPVERKRFAQETMDIYAPLANRLGIGQLKWELEDLGFRYIDPHTYKIIAHYLAERRSDREMRINEAIIRLKEELAKAHIVSEITGRAKHIYSIYLKMQRKDLDLSDIYDYSAVRLLLPTIADCYTALGIVHSLWEHIPEEFDDYIANPKPNGYSSIHIAVIGPDGKHIEIQIRTLNMHTQAEYGVAAHWVYKENKMQQSGYESKITYLRQLLAWHKDIAKNENDIEQINQHIFEDTVYVLTPAGDIVDLTLGATPLDFAYHVHTSIGHRCRGAKINGSIVPLTYTLKTGDQVDIITVKEGTPSRDWLNKEGYLKTARARAKVAQWFRQQDITKYIEAGKHNLEREFMRLGIHSPNLQKIAVRFNFKDDTALFAALGHGTIRLSQVTQVALSELEHSPESNTTSTSSLLPNRKLPLSIASHHIIGADNLLTRIAKCCKPIPGDAIVGYITQGRGVSIHRKTCTNMSHFVTHNQYRFLDVSWDGKQTGSFFVDLEIRAYGSETLLRELTATLANLKVDLINLNSTLSKKTNMIYITLTVQLNQLTVLQQLLTTLRQLPNIIDIKRIHE